MSDPVESMLEGLSASQDATRPAPAFLRAVARRRHRRQLTRAGIGVAALAAAAGLWQLVPSRATAPQRDGVIASAAIPLPEASLAALTRANAGADGQSLRLPEPQGSGPVPELRLGMRGDRLEQWLSQ